VLHARNVYILNFSTDVTTTPMYKCLCRLQNRYLQYTTELLVVFCTQDSMTIVGRPRSMEIR